MSRADRIARGFGIGLLTQVITICVGLWLTRFVLHCIGDHDYGAWVAAGQLIGLLSLIDIGVTALLPREIAAIAGASSSEEERDRALRELIGSGTVLVLLVVPALMAGSWAILFFLPSEWVPLRGPLTISLAALVFSYVARLGHAVLSGLQDFSFLAWVEIGNFAAATISTATLAALGAGLYAVAIGSACGQFVAAAAWGVRIGTRFRRVVPERLPRVDLRKGSGRIVTGVIVSLNQVALLLLNGVDVLIIGRELGPNATLRYTFTDKGETVLNNQPYAAASMSGPALAELHASGNRAAFANAIGAVANVVLVLSGGITIALLSINHAFVRAWIGEDHFGGMTLTVLLLANMTVRHLQFGFGVALFYAGQVRATTLLSLIDGVVSFILTVVLVRTMGIVGAPVASLVSVLVTHTPWTLMLLTRETGRSPGAALVSLAPWVIRFVPFAAAACVAGSGFGPRSVLGSALAAAILTAAYGLAMLPMLQRPPLDLYAAPYLSKIHAVRRRLLGAAWTR